MKKQESHRFSCGSVKNDDGVLIQRILAGDEDAFAMLVRKYQKRVHTLAWRKVRDFHIAEDITQETFLQVYQKLGTLEDPTRFSRWLSVIADRLCIAWLRKNQRQTEPLEAVDISEIEPEAYSRFIATEHAKTFAEAQRDLIERLLTKLTKTNRTVIILHYLEGMTYAEIGELLGAPENTIKSRLRRARHQLRKYEFMVQEALGIRLAGEPHAEDLVNGGFGMKLTFEKDALLSALHVLERVADGQDTDLIPSNVLIHADMNTIECMATDMEIGIRMKVEGTVREAGTIAVSAPKLGTIVRAWPAGKPIDVATTTDGGVEIRGNDAVHTLVKRADEEFPHLPSMDAGAFAIAGNTLRSVLHKTQFAAPAETVQQACLNGLYFNLFEDRTEVVGCDARQIAIAQCEPFQLAGDRDGFIVPLKAIKEIERTFANSAEIKISRVNDQVLFADEQATLTTRVVDAEYPKYERLMPEAPQIRVVVRKASILQATQQMAAVANPKCPKLCLEIGTQQIRISAEIPEPDETYETVAVDSSTGRIRIGFDARLLIGAFTHIETELLALEFSGELEPTFVKPIGAEGHICLVMPMLLKA